MTNLRTALWTLANSASFCCAPVDATPFRRLVFGLPLSLLLQTEDRGPLLSPTPPAALPGTIEAPSHHRGKPAKEGRVTPRRGRKAEPGLDARTCQCGDPEVRPHPRGAAGMQWGPGRGQPIAASPGVLVSTAQGQSSQADPDLAPVQGLTQESLPAQGISDQLGVPSLRAHSLAHTAGPAASAPTSLVPQHKMRNAGCRCVTLSSCYYAALQKAPVVVPTCGPPHQSPPFTLSAAGTECTVDATGRHPVLSNLSQSQTYRN
ncbi:hypothetical protein CB1_000273044 [Camelus ferus]|nr:hypothetical protein CB1_000273044 [Camelus ferus]